MTAVNVSVRMSDGSKIALEGVSVDATIRDVKELIEHKVTPSCPPPLQRLIFKGRILKDTDTVSGAGEARDIPLSLRIVCGYTGLMPGKAAQPAVLDCGMPL